MIVIRYWTFFWIFQAHNAHSTFVSIWHIKQDSIFKNVETNLTKIVDKSCIKRINRQFRRSANKMTLSEHNQT